MIECPRWIRRCRTFLRDEQGPTAVEYAVLLALITGACLASATLMAESTKSNFDRSADAIQQAFSP